MHKLRQIVPQSYCLKCDVCCRFPEQTSSQRPYFSAKEIKRCPSYFSKETLAGGQITLKSYQDFFICPDFYPDANKCLIYNRRSFDCQLYPFTITYDQTNENIILGMDAKCPFIAENQDKAEFSKHIEYLKKYLSTFLIRRFIAKNPKLIGQYLPEITVIQKLPLNPITLKAKFYGLRKIRLQDKRAFEKYLNKTVSGLSIYSFANIFLWKDTFNIYYKIINGNLCVFFNQVNATFMIIPPVGNSNSFKEAAKTCFEIMGDLNMGAGASRIENIGEETLERVRGPRHKEGGQAGYRVQEKHPEYIYKTQDLVNLTGKKMEDKRNLINFFTKNYNYKFVPFQDSFKEDCLALHANWSQEKRKKITDDMSLYMIEDSIAFHKNIFENYKRLGIRGNVVFVDGKISAYTFGFKLNKSSFCIIAEVTDISIKGLAQFIFKSFCKTIKEPYVNAMDDSGIENLKSTKLSYNPAILLNSYTAQK